MAASLCPRATVFRKHCRQGGADADTSPPHAPWEHRGDVVAEPKLTGTWMAHLLISSREVLHNLLTESAKMPQRINDPE